MPRKTKFGDGLKSKWYIHSDAQGFRIIFDYIPFEEHGQRGLKCLDRKTRDMVEVSEDVAEKIYQDGKRLGFKAERFVNYGHGIKPLDPPMVVKEVRYSLRDLIKKVLKLNPAASK